MTRDRFHYAFCNTLTRSASGEAFDEFVVPESRNVPRSTLGRSARIDFGASHVPMLFLAGTQDHLTPVAMVRRNAGNIVRSRTDRLPGARRSLALHLRRARVGRGRRRRPHLALSPSELPSLDLAQVRHSWRTYVDVR